MAAEVRRELSYTFEFGSSCYKWIGILNWLLERVEDRERSSEKGLRLFRTQRNLSTNCFALTYGTGIPICFDFVVLPGFVSEVVESQYCFKFFALHVSGRS